MVIHKNIVSIGPQAGLRAQECPDLIEGRPPDFANAAGRDLSADSGEQPRRNYFDLDVWTHSQKCGSGRRSNAERMSVTA
jgi:hypothetical protein